MEKWLAQTTIYNMSESQKRINHLTNIFTMQISTGILRNTIIDSLLTLSLTHILTTSTECDLKFQNHALYMGVFPRNKVYISMIPYHE